MVAGARFVFRTLLILLMFQCAELLTLRLIVDLAMQTRMRRNAKIPARKASDSGFKAPPPPPELGAAPPPEVAGGNGRFIPSRATEGWFQARLSSVRRSRAANLRSTLALAAADQNQRCPDAG